MALEDVNCDVIDKLEQLSEEIFSSTPTNVDEVKTYDNDELLKKLDPIAEDIESEFCFLYFHAIRRLINLEDDINVSNLMRFFRVYLTEISSWCTLCKLAKKTDKDFKSLLTSSLFYRIAYIYRIGVVLSSAVAFHFKNILIENVEFSKELLHKGNLKICSIGNGCAADVIGIAKVLEIVGKRMKIDLEIFATIIDADMGWKNTAMVALQGLEQFKRSTWKINFIQADVSKKLSNKVVQAIRDADIVTMVNMHSKEKIRAVLKNVSDVTRPGSLTFILDKSRPNIIQKCGGHLGEMDNHALIYEELCQIYTLQAPVVKKLFVLYHKTFPSFGNDRKLDVFARAWINGSADKMAVTRLKNRYSFKPQTQNSLGTNHYYRNWEVRFAKEMANLGWNRKGTDKVINQHRDTRSRLLKQNKGRKHMVNIAQENLTEDIELDSEEKVDEEEWKEFYDAKKDLALVKVGVCNISIYNLKCNLKRNLLGPVKKGTGFNRKRKKANLVCDIQRKKGNDAMCEPQQAERVDNPLRYATN